jgi:Tol biopolymer transport system component
VDQAVARALAKVPADRYPSGSAFVAALRSSGAGISHRRRVPMLIAAGLVAALTLGAVAIGLAPHRSSRPAGYRPLQLTYTGLASSPVLSPDGSQVAYSESHCDERQQCRVDLVIRETASGDGRVVVANLQFGAFWRWSPNGLWLLGFIGEPGQSWHALVLSRLGERLRDLGAYYKVDFIAGDTLAALSSPATRGGFANLDLLSATSAQRYGNLRLRAPVVSGLVVPVNLLVSPDARWIVMTWFTRDRVFDVTLHDRSGQLLDSLHNLPSADMRWDAASRVLLQRLSQSESLTGAAFGRLLVDARGRRFGRLDTLQISPVINANSGYDFSADGHSLVVATTQQGHYELWSAERRNTTYRPVRRLLRTSEGSGAWITRDGRTIVYHLHRGGDPGTVSWWAMPFDSGPARQLGSSQLGHEFILSLDGATLFAQQISNGRSQILAYDIAGGPARTLVELRDTNVALVESANGGVAVLNGRSDSLRIYSASGTPLQSLTIPQGVGLAYLFGAPDGSAYAFPGKDIELDPDGNWVFHFNRLDVRTGTIRPLAQVGLAGFGWYLWGSTGLLLEGRRTREWQSGLYRVPLDSSPLVRLGTLPFGDRGSCTMDNDGSRVACQVSNPVSDLYIIRDFDAAR